MTRQTSPATVTVHPSPDGVFLDGIPAITQDVPAEDAEWMVRSGAFVLTAPPASPVPTPADDPD